jgi:DNA-binding transcriptional regulator LsrR (DeoR family)
MHQELLQSSTSMDKIVGDPVAELVNTILSLYRNGMNQRAISELLSIHERQVSYLLED